MLQIEKGDTENEILAQNLKAHYMFIKSSPWKKQEKSKPPQIDYFNLILLWKQQKMSAGYSISSINRRSNEVMTSHYDLRG